MAADRRETAVSAYLATDPAIRTPEHALKVLAELSAATPDETWWIGVELNRSGAEVTGLSANALAAIDYIARQLRGRRVTLSDRIVGEADGLESFVVRIDISGTTP
ncbi:MAG: hypothetical protein AAFX08_12620 [Pseudomonadota bacterium]